MWKAAPLAEAYLDAKSADSPDREEMQRLLTELTPIAEGSQVELLRQRAQWRRDLGEDQAAADDWERIYELEPTPAHLQLRSDAYFVAGNLDAGLADGLQFVALQREALSAWWNQWTLSEFQKLNQESSLLNTAAYFRAVANQDLDRAEKDINRALEIQEMFAKMQRELRIQQGQSETDFTGFERAAHPPSMIDTRGFVYYRQGNYEAALKDAEYAVVEMSRMIPTWEQYLDQKRHDVAELRNLKLQYREQILKTQAVLIYHRGLVFQALQQTEKAEQDFQQVRDLGFKPDPRLF